MLAENLICYAFNLIKINENNIKEFFVFGQMLVVYFYILKAPIYEFHLNRTL